MKMEKGFVSSGENDLSFSLPQSIAESSTMEFGGRMCSIPRIRREKYTHRGIFVI